MAQAARVAGQCRKQQAKRVEAGFRAVQSLAARVQHALAVRLHADALWLGEATRVVAHIVVMTL